MSTPLRIRIGLVVGIILVFFVVSPSALSAYAAAPAGQSRTAAPSPAPSTGQGLIAQAQETGQISAAQALLYRAYALQGDPRLPAAFHAATNDDDTFALIADAARMKDTLPSDIAAQLHPYLVRPTNSDSIFNSTPASLPKGCTQPWVPTKSTNPPIDIWVLCTGKPADATDAQTVLADITQAWQPMTAMMGAPLHDVTATDPHDNGNTDTNVDLYIVPATEYVFHGGDTGYAIGDNDAKTVSVPSSDPTIPANATSGFMLLRRDRLSDSGFSSDLVHEFFHVLQYAHNAHTLFTCPGTFWFTEASATWAESHFARPTALKEVYARYEGFQKSALSMQNTTDTLNPYDSFIWPYFMEQESGIGSIVQAWKNMEGARSCADLMTALDSAFSFNDHFPDFALRNLNSSAFGVAPITPTYTALDPQFPVDKDPPKMQTGKTPTKLKGNRGNAGKKPKEYTVALPSLKAHYYHFAVNANVGQITFDFAGLSPQAALAISAVVKVNGQWEVRTWTGQTTVKICEASDAVDEIYLVVSNTDTNQDTPVNGKFTVQSLQAICDCNDVLKHENWTATISGTANLPTVTHDDGQTTRTASMYRTFTVSAPLQSFAGFVNSGTAQLSDTYTIKDDQSGFTQTNTYTGSSIAASVSTIQLLINPQKCTYSFNAEVTINLGGGSSQNEIVDMYADHPLTDNFHLNGSSSVPFYVNPPSNGSSTDYYQSIGQPDETASIYKIITSQDPIGTTSITWSFAPTDAAARQNRAVAPLSIKAYTTNPRR